MKKITVIISILLFSFLLTSCWNKENIDNNEPLTWKGSTVQNVEQNSINNTDSNKNDEVSQKINLLLIDKNNPLEADMSKDENVNITFLKEGNSIYDNILTQMQTSSTNGDIIKINPTEEWKAQWVEPLELKVREYYPLMVFKNTEKETTNLDLDQILIENPDMVYVFEENDVKYFAFKDPILVGGIKRIQVLENELVNEIKNSYILVSDEVSADKENLLLIEDPLCPYCAQSYLAETQLLDKYNVYVLPLALDIPWHENSDELSTMLFNNVENGKVNELLIKMFENQSALTNLTIKDWSEVKEILGLDDTFNTNISSNVYDAQKYEMIANELGVSGTPTKMKFEWNTFTLITAPEIELK